MGVSQYAGSVLQPRSRKEGKDRDKRTIDHEDHADHADHTDHTDHVDYIDHVDHVDYIDYADHIDSGRDSVEFLEVCL